MKCLLLQESKASIPSYSVFFFEAALASSELTSTLPTTIILAPNHHCNANGSENSTYPNTAYTLTSRKTHNKRKGKKKRQLNDSLFILCLNVIHIRNRQQSAYYAYRDTKVGRAVDDSDSGGRFGAVEGLGEEGPHGSVADKDECEAC